ncbi:hypothetical protein RHGRI_000520 [Rhododendron griersonianum]|uniref:NAC domain-containing protein n=1 Tax=Rhododendron griersonianum TaxID=479676 RepID=A0AAV6LJ99_9ERIC|nr:hypothetical protein RHGRI_000520 [Rhododendron griersonianum]
MSTVPPGYRFRPTDEELLDFLKQKSKGNAVPCDVVIERQIYGADDKAPWQIFTDEDPWEICRTKDEKTNLWKTEGMIYVFSSLIKGRGKKRARTAGCGSWHGETALEQVFDMDEDDISMIGYKRSMIGPSKKKRSMIGYKRILCFKISNETGAIDRSVTKGHWIMHEYSLPGGGECVLCRIKRDDSKDTKISPRIGKNVEAATTDDGVVVPKPAKHARTGLVEEKKMDCHIVAALTTPRTEAEVDPFLEEVLVQEQSFTMSNDPNELTVEEFVALWEEQENVETWLSAELLPSDQESDGFLSPNSMFHATAEPSPIFSFSDEFFWGQQKNYMSQLDPEPYGGSKTSHDGKRTSSLSTVVR